MPIKTYAIITAAALIGIGAGAVLWSRTGLSPDDGPAALAELRVEVAQLRAELAAKSQSSREPSTVDAAALPAGVMQRLSLLEQKLAATQGTASDSEIAREPLNPEAAAAAARAEREAQAARNEAYAAELRGTLDNQLAIDSSDSAAETQLNQSIDTAFADGTFDGSEVTQVQCGSSLCRLEIHSANLQAQETFVARYGAIESLMEGESLASRAANADGSFTTVLYSMRGAGTRLPQVALTSAQTVK